MSEKERQPADSVHRPGPQVPIRCVALDAVGTLIEADPPVVDAYAEVGRCHGSRLKRAEVGRRFAAALTKSVEMDLAKGPAGLATSEEAECVRVDFPV